MTAGQGRRYTFGERVPRQGPGRRVLTEASFPMRTFSMRLYAALSWGLAGLFAYMLVLFVLPDLDSPNTAAFLPVIVGFGLALAAVAVAATFWTGAVARPWFWLVGLAPAVLFLLMNAIYLPYSLTHPADPGFTAALPLIAGVAILVAAGVAAFGEARARSRAEDGEAVRDRLGARGRLGVAVVAAAVGGAVATSFLATAAGAMGGGVADPPTVTGLVTAANTKFVEASLQVRDGEVLGLFVVNKDGFAHSFDIDALDIHVQLPANSTTAVAIKPTAPGPLEFYCAVPGHREAGMVGTIAVR
jgi:uncharacterized cupredoxin-like copper-binding protein